MESKTSIHQSVHSVFLRNPQKSFTSTDLVRIINSTGSIKTSKEIVTMILTRLYRKGVVHRTETQLSNGYHYSLSNKNLLRKIQENYLLPVEFEKDPELISKINQNEFETLQQEVLISLSNIKSDTINCLLKNSTEEETKKFLAHLVAFVMCDGSIDEKCNRLLFFFRRKSDAKKFAKKFKVMFPTKDLTIKPNNGGASYTVSVCKSTNLAKTLHALGAPKGNKVFQQFLVPNWIYHGPDEVKKVFLSTVIGNEGSAPSDGRWRIQFVLSKSKEHTPNLLEFLNQIRTMLYHFGITTSYIQLRKQKGRQFHGRFYIKGQKNLRKFYNNFSFLYASEKQEVLGDLIENRKVLRACNTL